MEGCAFVLLLLFGVAFLAAAIGQIYEAYPVQTVLAAVAIATLLGLWLRSALRAHRRKKAAETVAAQLKAEEGAEAARLADLEANRARYAGYQEGQTVRTIQGQVGEVVSVRRDMVVVRLRHNNRIESVNIQHIARIEG